MLRALAALTFTLNSWSSAQAESCRLASSVALDFGNAVPNVRPEEGKDFLPSIEFAYYNEQLTGLLTQRDPRLSYKVRHTKAGFELSCERLDDPKDCPSAPGPILALKSANPPVMRVMGFIMVDKGELKVCAAKGVAAARQSAVRSLDFPRDEAHLASVGKDYAPDCATASYRFGAQPKYRYHSVSVQKFSKQYGENHQDAEAQIIVPHTREVDRAGVIRLQPNESLISDCRGLKSIVPDAAQVPGQYGGAKSAR